MPPQPPLKYETGTVQIIMTRGILIFALGVLNFNFAKFLYAPKNGKKQFIFAIFFSAKFIFAELLVDSVENFLSCAFFFLAFGLLCFVGFVSFILGPLKRTWGWISWTLG